MACGVGACLVCACPVGGGYARCCKDGPVFNASEVRWQSLLNA
jgi:dihydroorotate dehydrogenase electron transfer subunit